MSGRLSQNSPAGRRSHIRVVRPVDVAAVLLHTEARAFTRRALTFSRRACLPTIGGNLGGAFALPLSILRPHKRLQHNERRNATDRSHSPVRLVLHECVSLAGNSILHRAGRRDG